MVFELNLGDGESSLEEKPQRQFGELCLYECTDRLVAELKDLLTLLVPLVILRNEQECDCIRTTYKYLDNNKNVLIYL